MTKMNRRVAGLAMVALVILLDLVLAIYHLTHGGGWRSGINELVLAAVLITAVVLLLHLKGGLGLPAKSGPPRTTGLVIIGVCACIFLFLSPYHFTHDGLRSGIIEACLTCQLVLIGYLMAWPQRS